MSEPNIIQTPNFDLAVYQRGSPDAQKLVLSLPGKLDTKDYPNMRSHVDFLAENGYLALAFDPPGTWESPGGIEQYTMSNYLQAVHELIEHFGNRPTVLVGHSRGGSIALLEGARNKHVTHVVAAMSRPGMGETPKNPSGPSVSSRDSPSGEPRTFALPPSYFADTNQYSAPEGHKILTKPKLFIVGKQDTTISPDAIRAAYDESAQPKQLHEVDVDHDYRRNPRAIAEVNEAIKRFLNETNK